MAKFIFLLLFALIIASVHAKDTSLNIACGRSDKFTDTYGNVWFGDGSWATVGYPATVSKSYAPTFEPLNTLRSFAYYGTVSYGFKLVPAGTRVTVATQFYYGDYDSMSKPPTFFVRYDDYEWYQIFTHLSINVTYTRTYTTSSDTIIVYLGVPENDLVNVPFVNTIQISGTGVDQKILQTSYASKSSAPPSSTPKDNSDKKGVNVAAIVVPIVLVLLLAIIGPLVCLISKRNNEAAQGRMYPNPGFDGPPTLPPAYPNNQQYSQGSVPSTYDPSMQSGAEDMYYPQGPTAWPPAPSMEPSNMQYSQGNHVMKKTLLDASTRNVFTYNEILEITNHFGKQIGKGGSGSVYHGRLKNGHEVAVKVLNESPNGPKEFKSEVELLLTVHHKSIARFVGYCEEGQSLILLYEYMKGGNLRQLLSGQGSISRLLTWEKRLRIAQSVATGLDYLHAQCDPPIIHRDVKTTNILLNEKLQGKISDFGLSKATLEEDVTYISTVVAGTPGYIDPEYYATNNLTKKSDVYSFGVVLFEIISGHSPILTTSEGRRCNLIQYMIPMIERRDLASIADPNLGGQYNADSMWKVAYTAMACTAEKSSMRPTMADVVSKLKEAFEAQQTSRLPAGEFAAPSTVGHGVPVDEFVPASTSSTEQSSSYNPYVSPPPAR